MIGCYCRVSTDDQSLDRQMNATTSYVHREFDADLNDIEIYQDDSLYRNEIATGTNALSQSRGRRQQLHRPLDQGPGRIHPPSP